MHAYLRAFWLPKEGNTESEYEDAFFPNKGEYPIGKRPRFAIADGATEASFSRLWARMLVRGFVRRSLGLQLSPAELEPFRERWKGKVHAKALPWYAEEKAACGAFAALLGLEFSHETSGNGHTRNWQATAAGDCCLVQIRQNEIITTFPYGDSVAFNNRQSSIVNRQSICHGCTGGRPLVRPCFFRERQAYDWRPSWSGDGKNGNDGKNGSEARAAGSPAIRR